MKSSG